MKHQHYISVPLAVLLTAMSGSMLTQRGLAWYGTLKLPSWTPPAQVIGLVWTLIFILLAVGMMLVFTSERDSRARKTIIWIFLINCLLNVGWSFIFFYLHDLRLAVVEALILALSVFALIVVSKPLSKTAAWLLAPYLCWILFAAYLTHQVAGLNPYW